MRGDRVGEGVREADFEVEGVGVTERVVEKVGVTEGVADREGVGDCVTGDRLGVTDIVGVGVTPWPEGSIGEGVWLVVTVGVADRVTEMVGVLEGVVEAEGVGSWDSTIKAVELGVAVFDGFTVPPS